MQTTAILGLLDKLREAASKMSFLSARTLNIIRTVCVIITFGVVVYDFYTGSQKEHLDPTTRFVISGKVREDLTDLREICGAGKTFLLGYHNGVANFTRIPFVFADIRYEIAADSIEYTSDLFSNISLDKFSFAERHITDESWYGPIDKLNDARLENVFKLHKVKYVYFSNIKNNKGIPVATVVLCWYNSAETPQSIKFHDNIIKSYVRNIKASILSHP